MPNTPSSNVRPAVTPGQTASSSPSGASGRRPAAGSGRGNIADNRAALGLTALKPSEMIKGLDEAAKRAEKLEEREEAKRRAGGKANLNDALKVDDTGRRWSRVVNLIIVGTILFLIAGGAFLVYSANKTVLDPRVGNAEARQTLSKLMGYANRIKKFSEDEAITADAAKQRIVTIIDDDLKLLNDQIDKDKERKAKGGAKYEAPRGMLTKDRDALAQLRKLTDPWDQPITFSMADADNLKISAVGMKAPGTEPPEPITVNVRAVKKAVAPEK
jgi:hypothetical protein